MTGSHDQEVKTAIRVLFLLCRHCVFSLVNISLCLSVSVIFASYSKIIKQAESNLLAINDRKHETRPFHIEKYS